jgi:hypothetical protein
MGSGLSSANLMNWQVAKLIRDAGYWCDSISDIRPDLHAKGDGVIAVRVTCDTSARFAQYRLEFNDDDTLRSITKLDH